MSYFTHCLTDMSSNCISLKRNESSNLPEFLRQHLERQYGEKAGEWAYSLVEGIRQHQKDDSVSLFNDILTGKVCDLANVLYSALLMSVRKDGAHDLMVINVLLTGG